jgi:hypothetical protein
LQTLDMTGTPLNDEALTVIAALPHLTFVRVTDCGLSDEQIGKMHRLNGKLDIRD